jgi:hypothetical protein
VSDVRGPWRRSMIARGDGTRDITSTVRWLQGARMYVDLRSPAPAPDFSAVGKLSDLSMQQCVWLAKQEGFAGHLTFDGAFFEWARLIDFQPASGHADAGSLQWDREILVERGRDSEYIEHWHRNSDVPAASVGAVELRERGRALKAILVRHGNTFMFARDRVRSLPALPSLVECLTQASTLAQAQEWIDCEISAGELRRHDLYINASTLPFRIGQVLRLRRAGKSLFTTDQATDGTCIERHWEIVAREGGDEMFDMAGVALRAGD